MELSSGLAMARGYGSVCWSPPAEVKAMSANSSLSFCHAFTNPLIYNAHRKQQQQGSRKKMESTIAGVKWQKDPSLDLVIQRQKRLRRALKIKDVLIKEPGMCMSLRDLGKYNRKVRFTESGRLITLLRRYPAIFELFDEGTSNKYLRLTQEAEELFLKEQQLKADMESFLVSKIRKLLMMSIDKTLLVFKIAHLKKDLGLPEDYKTNLLNKYPQFFRPVELEAGPALQLTSWDPELAISTWERKLENGPLEYGVVRSHAENARRYRFPKSYRWKSKQKEAIRKLQDMKCVSPYTEFAHLIPNTPDAEKHSCAVVHEVLSLTLEKRVNIDFLTHFRRDYRFSQQLYGMLVRHPELFYVSRKGDRDSVFLREAYRGSQLIDKDPLYLVQEKLGVLIASNRQESNDGHDDTEEDDEYDSEEGGEGDSEGDKEEDYYTIKDTPKDMDEEDDVGGVHAQPTAMEAPNRRERVPRRPLIILQREKEMATGFRPVERW